MKTRFNPSLMNLAVVLLVSLLALAPLFPQKVTPASSPPELFSAERALIHLPIIAKEAHPSGSPAQAVVRAYLVQQLTDLGLEVELQKVAGGENVLARLHGTDPSGAILIQAHYDSFRGPGAADNGAGVAALVEIMRALTALPTPKNDIIAFFDDSEELPDAFTGTIAFVRRHPWMEDVRVAIGMDTAGRGFISANDLGENNGWMVEILARVKTDYTWTSLSGGGTYDTESFKNAGVQVLELEDNYPFVEQHTPYDTVDLVHPGSLQQLGDQALAVTRELENLNLQEISGAHQTYMYLLFFGLLHYPMSWVVPLGILAFILFILALGWALWQHFASWKGLGIALLTTLVTTAVAAIVVNAIWIAAPDILGWQTQQWSEWPEVIPPNGWWIFIFTHLLIIAITTITYRLARRWILGANYYFVGMFLLALFSLALAFAEPRAAILVTWPVLVGSLVWIAGLFIYRKYGRLNFQVIPLIAAIPTILHFYPLIPAVFMGDGTKSVAITAGALVVILAIVLPGLDDLVVNRETVNNSAKN